MQPQEKLISVLAEHNYKNTRPRKEVFLTLYKASEPLANSAVISKTSTIDKVSVYRTLEIFEKIGIVRRTWNGFKSTVELSEHFVPHHHHAQCQSCGRRLAISSPKIERALQAAAEALEFHTKDHHVELIGLCKGCK